MSLQIIQDEPSKYHFKTKDDQRVDIEHKNEHIILNLFKWGEEASLQILLDTVPTPNHKFSENKIEVENPDFLLRVYPIDTRSTGDFYGDSEDDVQCHDGGLRFELILKKKRPAMNNSFVFPIVSKNLRFSYQPFLTQEDIDAGVRCPLNVEGSYAVYHVSKKNNKYMTGKAFHLFRPIAEDALGVKAWCSLDIDEYIDPTSLTITIPQQFLDDATYPIVIDPDFGYTTIGAAAALIGDTNRTHKRGSAWSMPAPGGTANYIRARIYSTGNTSDCKAFINQKDSAGAGSHDEIARKENLACAIAEHWEEFTLSGEVLTEGVVYILGVDSDIMGKGGGQYSVKQDADGCIESYLDYDISEGYCNEVDPWVVITEVSKKDYSIYCNYDEAAVPPAYPLIDKPLVAPIIVGRPKIR